MQGQETTHLKQLFADLYDGQPWLDVTLADTLKELTAAQALARVLPGRNSIIEILNHVIAWRDAVFRRVQGENVPSPPDNFFQPVEQLTEKQWHETLATLGRSQQVWLDFLEGMNNAELDSVSPHNGLPHYKHIHGILQHDAYHLGQIVLLIKVLETKG